MSTLRESQKLAVNNEWNQRGVMQTQENGTESELDWFRYLDLEPTEISAEEFTEQTLELADVGVGLKLKDVDTLLELRGEGMRRDVRFNVGTVSISWGVLARIRKHDIMMALQEHVALGSCSFRGRWKVNGNYEDSVYSFVYNWYGTINIGTFLERNETDIRFNRRLCLRATDFFLD